MRSVDNERQETKTATDRTEIPANRARNPANVQRDQGFVARERTGHSPDAADFEGIADGVVGVARRRSRDCGGESF